MLHFSVLVTGVPLACSRVSKLLSHPFTPAEVRSHLMLSSNKYFSYIPSFNKSCKFFRVPPYLIFFFATYSREISQLVLWGCNCRSSEVCVVANCTESLWCRLGLVMLLHGSGHAGRTSAAPANFQLFPLLRKRVYFSENPVSLRLPHAARLCYPWRGCTRTMQPVLCGVKGIAVVT